MTTYELNPSELRGWRSGFANLLHKEGRMWFGSPRWWIQPLLWTGMLDGLLALVVFVLPIVVSMDPTKSSAQFDPMAIGFQAIFQLGPLFVAVGAVIVGQNLVLGERESGVAEWILTKPVSRAAYMLAKLVASSAGALVTMVLIPSGVAYGLLSVANGRALPPIPFLTCVLGLALHTLFYLTLTLMLGVVVSSRERLLATAFGTLFAGLVIPGFLGKLAFATPWILPATLPALGTGQDLPMMISLPLVMTAVWCCTFVGLALWQFERIEY